MTCFVAILPYKITRTFKISAALKSFWKQRRERFVSRSSSSSDCMAAVQNEDAGDIRTTSVPSQSWWDHQHHYCCASAPVSFTCLVHQDSKLWECAIFSTEGGRSQCQTLSDNIHIHSHIHTHIPGLTLALNFAEGQVPSVSNLLNKLYQNCQVGYFSPFSETKLLGWENIAYSLSGWKKRWDFTISHWIKISEVISYLKYLISVVLQHHISMGKWPLLATSKQTITKHCPQAFVSIIVWTVIINAVGPF